MNDGYFLILLFCALDTFCAFLTLTAYNTGLKKIMKYVILMSIWKCLRVYHPTHCCIESTMRLFRPATLSPRGCFEEDARNTPARRPVRRWNLLELLMISQFRWVWKSATNAGLNVLFHLLSRNVIFIALQREVKLELFRDAVDSHSSLTNQASKANSAPLSLLLRADKVTITFSCSV